MASRRIRRTKSLAGYTAAVYQDIIDLKTRSNYRTIAGASVAGDNLAEEIELINKSLQSSNYAAGVDGWKLDGSGNAEFGNVYVRGDINAYSGTIGYWNISNPAVERTFGNTTLFGTFLESFDHGFTDADATIGTYVSLFKSYIDTPTPITSISVTSDIVTITAPDHNFFVGDKIVIEFNDSAYSSYESNTYLVVTETTPDTFSYIKRTQDSGTAGNTVPDVVASGVAQIYNEDVAGLYLRDYSKANFDYGFFSNKGISYVSAENLNLVHNPSFEYTVGGTNTYSNTGWSATSGINQMTFSSGYSTARYASKFGSSITWTSSNRTDYLTATVDYKAGNNYNIFSQSSALYLGFDIYCAPPSSPIAVSTVVTTDSVNLTITTTAAHGLSSADYVYLNFSAMDAAGDFDYAYDRLHVDYGPKVFNIASVTSNTFKIKNVWAATETLTLSASPTIYRTMSPAFKLSEIKFKFGSNTSTTLESLLTDTYTITDWASADNKELSISATTTIENKLNSVAIPSMKNGAGLSYLPLDPQKIENAYLSLDPTGYANGDPFYILLPTWTYKKDLDGATTATKLLNTSYVIDNVYLSKSTKFFYGESSTTSNSWYLLGSGTAAPAQASVESAKSWIDLDLDTQTAVFDYIDYVGLKSLTYNDPLFTPSSISMAPSSSYFSYTDYLDGSTSIATSESNTLSITAGKSTYLSGSSYVSHESYINLSVDRSRSGIELVSSSDYVGFYGNTASLSVYTDKGARAIVGIQADYIIADTAKFITNTGNPSLNASYITNNTNNSKNTGTNHLAYTIETSTVGSITSTSYAQGTTPCYAYFTTGPSGVAEIHVYGYLDNDTTTAITYLSFEIAPASDINTPVVSASDNRAVINLGTNQSAASVFYLFVGSPNTRYKIKTMHRVNAGTGTLNTRSVMAIPIT